MAKNQRQRRPLQEDKRTDRKTPRERQQQARRQRDRIEENRDRRELRRERERLRRTTVDSVRSPKEDLRTERTESRLVPIEDTFLGRPIAVPNDLPVLIGERWSINPANQTIPNSTDTTLTWVTPTYTTERNGYPALLVDGASSEVFRIPAGLSGIWQIHSQVTWSAATTAGIRNVAAKTADDVTYIAYSTWDGESTGGNVSTRYLFQEGDEFFIEVLQDSGGDLDLVGGAQFSYVELTFQGK